MDRKKTSRVLVCLLIATGVYLLAQAGSLDPPGPPASTMKTLDQVEPRVPVHASEMPRTLDASGSYYLAENISTAATGIFIDADDVTLDLQGFTLSGGIGDGIYSSSGRKNLTIRNGTVSGWSARGLGLLNADNVSIEKLVVRDNGTEGMWVGTNSRVVGSSALGNGGAGIIAKEGSVIRNCLATSNGGGGISAGDGSTISTSAADTNTGNGISVGGGSVISECSSRGNTVDGFSIIDGAVVSGCTAIDNGEDGIDVVGTGRGQLITGCTLMSNGEVGIDCHGYCQIRGNTLRENDLGGIEVNHGSLVVDNLVSGSGGDIGPAIEVINVGLGRNRIDHNSIDGYDTGILIDVASVGNVVTRNDVRSGINYSIPAGNDVGSIVFTVVGAGPLDNFSR